MKIENLIDYDLFTYLVVGVIMVSIIIAFCLIKSMYRRREKKVTHFKRMISSIFLLLLLTLVFYYYHPVILNFKEPTPQGYDIFVYKSQPNSTGGITEDRYALSYEKYLKIINILNNASLSRQIIDQNKNEYNVIQYDIVVVPVISEYNGIYLNEMRLYVDKDNEYRSYIIATHNKRKQTYKIKDIAVINNLITELTR